MGGEFRPERHRAQTDRTLLVGGFGVVLVLAAVFTTLFMSAGAGLLAAGIVVGAGLLALLIYLLLSGLERLAQ
jgi:tryptophan-rich sensory protein